MDEGHRGPEKEVAALNVGRYKRWDKPDKHGEQYRKEVTVHQVPAAKQDVADAACSVDNDDRRNKREPYRKEKRRDYEEKTDKVKGQGRVRQDQASVHDQLRYEVCGQNPWINTCCFVRHFKELSRPASYFG